MIFFVLQDAYAATHPREAQYNMVSWTFFSSARALKGLFVYITCRVLRGFAGWGAVARTNCGAEIPLN